MAYPVDNTQELTITLAQEGVGAIVSFTADKISAAEGEMVTLYFTLRNDGATVDTLFATIVDDYEQTVLPIVEFPSVSAGVTVESSVQITMPSRNYSLVLLAGHVE